MADLPPPSNDPEATIRRNQLETDRALINKQAARAKSENLLRIYQGARSEIDAALQDVQASAGKEAG